MGISVHVMHQAGTAIFWQRPTASSTCSAPISGITASTVSYSTLC